MELYEVFLIYHGKSFAAQYYAVTVDDIILLKKVVEVRHSD